MAGQGDSGGKDDVKTQFVTREGTYRLMTLSEYSRPNRVGYSSGAGSAHVRVSLVTLPPAGPGPSGGALPAGASTGAPAGASAGALSAGAPGGAAPSAPAAADSATTANNINNADTQCPDERICFNHGKELYVYVYRGCKKAADLTKPVDKKIYKGTNPTCHDFNTVTVTSESVSLIIGFSTGQIQLIDPIKKELSKLYNEERLIDKTRVTCIRWVPGSGSLFVAAHASGQLYVYGEELPSGGAPSYQLFKGHDHYSVHTCRTKSTRNPLYRWVIGNEGSCINEFAFSECGAYLAVVSQDGFLRVFHYDTMELVGRARSYFGGFLCVCWSPDARLVAVGGEDDLVTVWSLAARGVVARGQGHRSWVSVVAFDSRLCRPDAYRLGSVSHDTQLCLWELAPELLRPAGRRHLSPAPVAPPPAPPAPTPAAPDERRKEEGGGLAGRLAGLGFGERRSGRPPAPGADPLRLVGTPACPRFDECPLLEPLVCKKVAHERLTALLFRRDCLLTAAADGTVHTWQRPGGGAPGGPLGGPGGPLGGPGGPPAANLP